MLRYRDAIVYFKDRTGLVGSLRNREQLEINLKDKFYKVHLLKQRLGKLLIKIVELRDFKYMG